MKHYDVDRLKALLAVDVEQLLEDVDRLRAERNAARSDLARARYRHRVEETAWIEAAAAAKTTPPETVEEAEEAVHKNAPVATDNKAMCNVCSVELGPVVLSAEGLYLAEPHFLRALVCPQCGLWLPCSANNKIST